MLFFLLLSVFSVGSALGLSVQYYADEDAYDHFMAFQQKYDKRYNSMDEQINAFGIFKNNLQIINRLNNESSHAVFAITKFSDLTQEEFAAKYKGFNTHKVNDNICPELSDDEVPDGNAPSAWDWRSQGAVTAVKDQGSCGSCWAFSATGHLEGQYAIKYRKQIVLSEQQLLDCDEHDYGCNGGLMTSAFRSIMEQGGIALETDYPYTAEEDECRHNIQPALKVNSCNSYNLQSQDKVKQLLYAKGPIAIAITASAPIFQHYQGGIITDDQCGYTDIDHGVLLVGYGDENGKAYWLVKNSWGSTWGDQGYFKMQRGNGANSCSLMNNYMGTAEIA